MNEPISIDNGEVVGYFEEKMKAAIKERGEDRAANLIARYLKERVEEHFPEARFIRVELGREARNNNEVDAPTHIKFLLPANAINTQPNAVVSGESHPNNQEIAPLMQEFHEEFGGMNIFAYCARATAGEMNVDGYVSYNIKLTKTREGLLEKAALNEHLRNEGIKPASAQKRQR